MNRLSQSIPAPLADLTLRCSGGPNAETPVLSVVLPAHNEATQISSTLARVVGFLRSASWSWEIVVAENGSSDATAEIARSFARGVEGVQVKSHPTAGRGAALRSAWLGTKAEIVAYMDVDLSTDLTCLPALISPIYNAQADIAVGSRMSLGSRTTRSVRREILSRGYNLLARAALGLRFRDTQCGFKALRRTVAVTLLSEVQDSGWFFDTELLFLAQLRGFRVLEIPVRWVDDPTTTVRLLPTIWNDLCGLWRLRRSKLDHSGIRSTS
jgi:glycosyltransferase involved in cell wall biosynthesis